MSLSIPFYPFQVLVGIASVGLNPVETYIRAGQRAQSLPYIPGSDGAGKVLQIGDEVSDLQVSDVDCEISLGQWEISRGAPVKPSGCLFVEIWGTTVAFSNKLNHSN